MDDATLEKLSISPGKLSPKFKHDIREYAVTVGSNVKELKVNPLTSDNNACYSISGGNGGKIVPLQEGQVTVITIEVTAEDGTIQNYVINATRLSASDASLSNITISTGILSPPFNPKCTQYTVVIPYHVSTIEVQPSVADKTTVATLREQPSDNNISLYYGETQIFIDVTSPDQTRTNTYNILISRKKPQWPISFIDEANSDKFRCALCLCVLHYPRSINETKHIFCKHCINELTRTVKKDPLNEQLLTGDWQKTEEQIEKEMSLSEVHCIYERYGCTEKMKLMNLGLHMKQCAYRLCLVDKSHELCKNKDLGDKTKTPVVSCADCNLAVRPPEVEHHKTHLCISKKSVHAKSDSKVSPGNWEKKLQQETSEKSVEKLVEVAEEQLQQYSKSLQVYVQTGHCNHESSPINHLKHACECYATAISLSPKEAKLHFKLGQICEELHYAEDWYGLKQEGDEEIESIDFNQQSRDSSKEDDIQAICEQRGVGRNAPLALQLKAIDEEYHYLLDNQQSDRCEYVQKLYSWKSKQATSKEGKPGQKAASDEEGWFGKACVKYNDALSCSPDNYLYHLHVARFLLLQGKHENAFDILQTAVGLKPVNVEARFYLGLVLLECSNREERREEGLNYVHQGLEHLLYKQNTAAEYCAEHEVMTNHLHSDDLLNITNIQCLQGFLTIGKTLMLPGKVNEPAHSMSAHQIFCCVASMTMQALCLIVNRGEMYHQLEWCLLQAHYHSLQALLVEHKKDSNDTSRDVIIERCENLSSLINVLSVAKDKALLELQEKTCQQGVILQPNNSKALWLLGNAQLGRYDNDMSNNNSEKSLSEAEQCFRVSIQLEGQPSRGGVVCDVIKEQDWWKQRHTTTTTTTTTPGNQRVSPTKNTITKGRGRANNMVAKNVNTTKPVGRQPVSKSPTTMMSSSKTPASSTSRKNNSPRTTSTSKTTSTSVKQPATKTTRQSTSSRTNIANASSKPSGKAAGRVCSHTETTNQKVTTPSSTTTTPSSTTTTQDPYGSPNTPSYHARLGLARVLSRRRDAQCQTFYHEVIKMCPSLHDAYIELGDILVQTDPLGAVGVYSRYPFPDPLSYDDAFLHGEIVRHLVKQEKFEDTQLSKSLIALGKVMGLSVIEKYVDIIDSKLKYRKLLMEVYAGVHGKSTDDPDLQNFFRFKCWL